MICNDLLAYYVVANFDGKKSAILTLNILERNLFIYDFLHGDFPQVEITQKKFFVTDKDQFNAYLHKVVNGIDLREIKT